MFIFIFVLTFLYSVNAKFFLGNFNSINLSDDLRINIQEKWFNQNLDHFQPQDTRQWKQRYFVDCKYYKGNGPLFLEIGGEGPINYEKFLMSNMADNLAKKFEACSFQLEHRFYGKSQPLGDWSVGNLQYLTSEQALADLANFIETISLSQPEFEKSKWIVFGGSYAGALSAWMRLKYPHLVTGSISSSAPVQAKLDFVEYMEVVGESLGKECSLKVKSAMEEVKIALKTPEGVKKIREMFNVCNFDVTDKKTVQNFYSNIVDSFAGVVQYNEDNRGGKRSNVTIKTICNIMLDEKIKNGLVKLSNIKKIIKKQNEKCEDVSYIQSVKELRNSTIDFTQSSRQWTYQTCNEFGYYQTTTSLNQPFTDLFDIDFYTDMCVDVYGSKFNIDYIKKAIVRTNMIYGSKNLNADRILLLNGSIDPWHALGLTNYQYLNTTSIYIKGTAHCADMYPKSESDLPGLTNARNVIEKQIEFFLNE